MDVSPILDSLNDRQRQAVTAELLPTLVIAGAGSGKTRVLAHRIAWLCEVESVSPSDILAVTFTNKAAAEMRVRVEKLLRYRLGGMWIGTFHGIAHRLLRAHWREAELQQGFQILDSDDQLRLVRRIILELGLDDSKWPPKRACGYINARKEESLRPQHLQDRDDVAERQLIRIYTAYQEACEQTGQVDFAELLLRSLELLRGQEEVRTHYTARFRHVLVDEFQDTNKIQYQWLKVLVGDNNSIFAVGDDDQSIYGWRGARIENIQSFEVDYKNTQLFRLEQNYRSTGTILGAANSLIGNNHGRMGKDLWTDEGAGEPICLYASFNERDEAHFVANRIKSWTVDTGCRRSETAVLYRSNAQSRIFEEVFISQGIPYRVYGGLRFFERAEIKDALAYLRLARNAGDNASFERIVNVPARGIGAGTMAIVRDFAKRHRFPLWQAVDEALKVDILTARAANALREFLHVVRGLSRDLDGMGLAEQVEHVIQASGLIEYHGRRRDEKSKSRVENLEELVVAARGFHVEDERYADMQPLDAFLTHAALEAGEGQGTPWDDCVHFMTLHAAKGLEFPLVFIVGLEEGLFPSSRSLEEPRQLEEERRLCYVGMTRAQRQLVLTYAESRRRYGLEGYHRPSRFISEIPQELITEVRPRAMTARLAYTSAREASLAEDTGIKIGGRVAHAKFGEGVVLDCEGAGSSTRVRVHFEGAGSKWLVLAYANLDVLA